MINKLDSLSRTKKVCNDCKDNILIALDIYKEKNKSENTCTNLNTCVSSVIKNLSFVKINYQPSVTRAFTDINVLIHN